MRAWGLTLRIAGLARIATPATWSEPASAKRIYNQSFANFIVLLPWASSIFSPLARARRHTGRNISGNTILSLAMSGVAARSRIVFLQPYGSN